MSNPFGAWFLTQPHTVTKASVARELGLDRTYVSDLMRDNNLMMPSLTTAIAIERLTRGKVKAAAMHDFVTANRQQREAA